MTQFKDSRVAAAFNGNQLQYQYMVGSEQRLTGLEGEVARLAQSSGTDPALVAQVATNTSNIASQQTNINILNGWVNFYISEYQTYLKRNSTLIQASQTQYPITASSLTDSGFSLPITTVRGGIFVFLSADDFFVSSGGSAATAALSFQLDGGADNIVVQAYSDNSPNQNTYGVSVSYLFTPVTPGNHTIKLRWRTSSGTTAYLGSTVSNSIIQFVAMEL